MTTRERRAQAIASMRAEADAIDSRATRTSENLVPHRGQPVLVGHHSQAAHERMLDRAHRIWDRQAAQSVHAAKIRRTANAMEAVDRTAIYDDDPDVVERLAAAIAIRHLEVDGIREHPEMGPLAKKDAIESVRRQIRDLKKRLDRVTS